MPNFPNAELEDILDNPEADRHLAKRAVERAVAEYGMTLEEAEKRYGYREPDADELTTGQINQLLLDATRGRKTPSIKGERAEALFKKFLGEVEQARKDGVVLEIPD